jgi:hypothetical protein
MCSSGLPTEALLQIFEYLPPSDRLQCSLVCQTWKREVAARSLHVKTTVTFRNDAEFARGFGAFASAAHTNYHRLCLSGIALRYCLSGISLSYECSTLNALWPRLTSLELLNCEISDRDLTSLLLKCSGLVSIGLIDAREALIAGIFLDDVKTREELRVVLANVRHLDLSNNAYMTDSLFNRITSCMQGLQVVKLDNCKVMNHDGIYKKFYKNGGAEEIYDSPSVFTYRCLLYFVRERAAFLKDLSLVNTGLDGLCVQHLASIDNLDLAEMDVGMCSSVTQEAIWELVGKQRNLKKLGLNYCRRVFADYPATSNEIFREIAQIRELLLVGLSIPKNLDLFLAETNCLQQLNVSTLDAPSRHLVDGIINSKSRFTLRSLSANNFGCSSDNLERLVQNLPNLRHLDLSHCQEAVTDRALQLMAKCLGNLQTLKLKQCRRLTDLGFTGNEFPLSGPPNVVEEARREGKILLGTKAEAGVIDDSKLKDVIMKAAEAPTDKDCVTIDGLRALSVFEVTATKMSDCTFRHAFRFLNLRSVDLTLSGLITDTGFSLLGEYNPSLERVVAKQCALTDKGLVGLVQCTRRLSILDIEGCKEVTSAGILQLPRHVPHLRHLDVSFCLKVKMSAVEEICMLLPRLLSPVVRGLQIAECLGDYEEQEYTSLPPPPAPPRQ